MVRLTDYVTSGGCACKIGPHILNRVLKAVTPVTNEHVLADMTGADDAGVYQISDTFALVQTLDFFTPMVNDPGLFGKIAAANALSDVYAMGGTPLTAMNIVGFPVPLVEQGVLTDVLNGAGLIVAELDQTIADMKTGNYENALIRFETRIGSPMLSDVIRGLIGVLRGDDQRMYFKMITFDMRQIEQNNLKKEAAKRPKKIQRYSMMMLICIMIIYLVVLCTEVMSSLGAFFG